MILRKVKQLQNHYIFQSIESIINEKTQEYEIGKRHLAKIMGFSADEINADKLDEMKAIENAIEYLLPSGLFSKKARPFLKPPEEYYPRSRCKIYFFFYLQFENLKKFQVSMTISDKS